MLNDLFQALNLTVRLADEKASVGGKVYYSLNFVIDSKYDPNIWK